jgi:hypothetical protein
LHHGWDVGAGILFGDMPDAMEMIGHDYHLATLNNGEFKADLIVPSFDHLSRIIQIESSIINMSEEMLSVLRTQSHKVRPLQRIVVAFQPDAAPMMEDRGVGHYRFLILLKNVLFLFI